MKLKALIVGLGRIGLGFDLKSPKGHILTHTKAFLNNRDIDLLGGIDINAEKRKAFEKFSHRKTWGSVGDFSRENSGKVDIVSLCTPDNVRLKEIKKILLLKPKLVIIEKPLALSLAEGKNIVRLLEYRKVKGCVNYIRRSDPFYSELKSRISAGYFGAPLSATVNYTGGLYSNGSHFVDLVFYYFGLPLGVKVIKRKKRANADIDASFVLFYKGFEVIFNAVPDKSYSVFEMDIFFSKGRVVVSEEGLECKASFYSVKKDPVLRGFSFLKRGKMNFVKSGLHRYQANVVSGLAAALKENKPLASSARSALETLSVCERVKNGV